MSNLSQQILRANPILEAFGNAQTVRNNNSSRFGKFIRIEFTRTGQIAGAFIDWYLLEKSRVVKLNSNERNYHVFYQLLRGADRQLKKELLLDDLGVDDFVYTREGNDIIAGVSDIDEWNSLIEAFHTMGFSDAEQKSVIRTVAAVLLLGNIRVERESLRADQAGFRQEALAQAEKVCSLLKIPHESFIQGLLHPKVKAGREWVEKVQTPEQVRSSLDALAKGIYERGFGDLVSRINRQLDRTGMGHDDSHFIGVLDIAGFEIFEDNSFEQLCINYTNEKLQQFFNHHMFVLEQEEYAREQIEWKFIDFGKDLQPTIDLIEVSNPIGIFSCLDEDSVMPKATDQSFTEKLHTLWDRKTPKYKPSRLAQGFILTHYAAEVEYSTSGWLEKNKDPLNDNITRLLGSSNDKHIATLFADCADSEDENTATRSRVKKGLFRTVAQRHKDQLSSLMNQLHSTHPHFVRCILPNHKKKPKQFNAPLVLDQLRCNGVLEGIRIARTGFPNRLSFSEFRQRYEVLCHSLPHGYLEGRMAAQIILEKLDLGRALYRVGLTKVFFRAGVLAELEEKRDALIRHIISRFQSMARGFTQRRIANKRLYREEATRIIQHNFRVYVDLCNNPWWRLLVRMKPLLGTSRTAAEVKRRDEMIHNLQAKMQQENNQRRKLEDERRRADTEVQRIQQTLESERSLALDKEEIFNRLRNRETELNEKLARAVEDQKHSAAEARGQDELIQQLNAKLKHECQQRQQLESERQGAEQAVAEARKLEEVVRELNVKLQLEIHQRQIFETERRDADKAEAEIGKLEEVIRELNAKVQHESKQRQRLENERRGAEQTAAELKKRDEFIEELKTKLQHENYQRLKLENERKGVEKAAAEGKKRDEALRELQINLQRESRHRERLEDERRRASADLRSAQQTLEKERSLAHEKEEILERLQSHEAELNKKLAGAAEDEENLEDQFSDLQIRLDAETSRAADLASSLNLYKRRADEYFSKLEHAEVAVLKASRAEQTAKAQAQESDDNYRNTMAERKQIDATVEKLQRQNQRYEEKIEDISVDLDGALQAKKRLQQELEGYRSQRAMDIEDKETSMEQTRRKYQSEFSTLTNELGVERENVIHLRSENARIRDELEELRSKRDEEVLKNSTWAKETMRLESALQDLSASKEEAVNAHHDAQTKIVSLLAQIRDLRLSVDEIVNEREKLQKEKRSLEVRLTKAGDRLEDLTRSESPSVRNVGGMDLKLLELKSHLAQQEDIATAAVGKMRRAEALAAEMQKDVIAEREINATLHKEKATLEKSVKDLQGRVVDLETQGYSSSSQDVKFLNNRVQEVK